MADKPFNAIQELIDDKISGAGAHRKPIGDEELEHERQLAAIRAGSQPPILAQSTTTESPARKAFIEPLLLTKGPLVRAQVLRPAVLGDQSLQYTGDAAKALHECLAFRTCAIDGKLLALI